MNPCHPKLWSGNHWSSDSYWSSVQMLTSGMHIEDSLLYLLVTSFVASSWELGVILFGVILLGDPATHFTGFPAMVVGIWRKTTESAKGRWTQDAISHSQLQKPAPATGKPIDLE